MTWFVSRSEGPSYGNDTSSTWLKQIDLESLSGLTNNKFFVENFILLNKLLLYFDRQKPLLYFLETVVIY